MRLVVGVSFLALVACGSLSSRWPGVASFALLGVPRPMLVLLAAFAGLCVVVRGRVGFFFLFLVALVSCLPVSVCRLGFGLFPFQPLVIVADNYALSI